MLADLLKRALYGSGALGAYHRLRNRDVLTVVMYHRVLSTADPRWSSCDPDYTVSDELFSQTVRFLKRHYAIVGVDQVIAARRGDANLPPRALLITFDDGWSDNADYALPILRRENVPALLFVVADAVGRHRPFFQEEMVAAWRAARLSPADVQAIARAAGSTRQDAEAAGLKGLRSVIAALEALPAADRSRILEPYADRLDDGLRHMVSVQDLARLGEGGVAIGLHGKSHTPMTRAGDLDAELAGAREALARLMGVGRERLCTMSFPHGRWTPEIVQRARDVGYALIFTSVPSVNALASGCPDVLGRLGIETEAAQDAKGRFRPDRLALRLFRRPAARLG